MNKAIITGTGAESLAGVNEYKRIQTEYGAVETYRLIHKNEEILILPRHGKSHDTPPHTINYHAQMAALKQEGIKYIYALATSGSIDSSIPVGSMVVVDDFLDFTTTRSKTFFDGSDKKVAHTDMSDPYCKNLRLKIIAAARERKIALHTQGVYVCTDGPRFEGKSEIAMFKKLGGTVVGMTGIPEVFLAKELGMCYACIALISNMACGIEGGSLAQIDHKNMVKQTKDTAISLILDVFESKSLNQDYCDCNSAVLYL
jgi:5'-methylthioadenosine phosphorylase